MGYEVHVPNELLVRARLEKGWSQAQLAEKVGTTFETVSRWERGTVMPGPYYREKLRSVLEKNGAALGFDVANSVSLPPAGPTRSVFLLSAYSDAEHKFVVGLKRELTRRGDITLWSSRTVKRQSPQRKSAVLQEAIHTVQLMLVILSPHTKRSTHVGYSRDLARHFRRPVCEVWIEGNTLEECLPENYGDPGTVIDARAGDEHALFNHIITTIERMWLNPGDPETAELSEPLWNVPELTKPLVGREALLERICALLRGPHTRLATLTGPGGIGKTHLAIQVALRLRERFVDGVCFVPLAAIRDPALVFPTIARELGIRKVEDSSPLERVKVALKDRHFLLVLDNFEHVLEAAAQLPELLAACPRLKIVVTSSRWLRGLAERSDESRFVLIELDPLSQDTAMMLFQQRGKVARGDFAVTPANASAIQEICARLDNLPLAIELAAARIGSSSPQLLLARLHEHFQDVIKHFIVDEERPASDRQHSLHNTIGWSYDLLSHGEKQLFPRLAVFAGSCDLEAIEALCDALGAGSLHVWKVMESLLEKNLVRSAEHKGEGRFQLLATMREYGLGLLEANGELLTVQRIHALYYLKLVEQAEPHLKGEQQATWLERLDQELENLRAALDWLVARQEAELALRFCAALWRFWRLYGYWSEGRRWLEATLALPNAGQPTVERTRALIVAGDLAYYQDDNDAARTYLEEGARLCRLSGMQRELAFALGSLGVLLHVSETHAAAHTLLDESEQLSRSLGNTWELAYLKRRTAQHAAQDGNLPLAVNYAQEGLALAKKIGDRSLAANTLSTLGELAARQGDIQQAITYNRESLSLARELNEKDLIALTINNVVYFTALQEGQPPVSDADDARSALKLARELGDRLIIVRILNTLGLVALRQDDLQQAALWYREGLSQALELDSREGTGWNIFGLALVAEAEKQYLQAARLLGVMATKLNVNTDMVPAEFAEYQRVYERLSALLGKKAFTAARNEGLHLSPAQVLVAPRPLPVLGTPPAPHYPNGLTKREVQILCLLTQGLTYFEIATRLHISQRTVNTALSRAYDKIAVSKSSTALEDNEAARVAPRIAAVRFMEEHDLC